MHAIDIVARFVASFEPVRIETARRRPPLPRRPAGARMKPTWAPALHGDAEPALPWEELVKVKIPRTAPVPPDLAAYIALSGVRRDDGAAGE